MSDPTPTPDCCDRWPLLAPAFQWWTFPLANEKRAAMPSIQVADDNAGRERMMRVNFCPSCGAPRRDTVRAINE